MIIGSVSFNEGDPPITQHDHIESLVLCQSSLKILKWESFGEHTLLNRGQLSRLWLCHVAHALNQSENVARNIRACFDLSWVRHQPLALVNNLETVHDVSSGHLVRKSEFGLYTQLVTLAWLSLINASRLLIVVRFSPSLVTSVCYCLFWIYLSIIYLCNSPEIWGFSSLLSAM